MSNKNLLRRVMLYSAGASFLALSTFAVGVGGVVSYRLYQMHQNQDRVIGYIHDNSTQIIKEVEEKFGIKFENVNLRYVDHLPPNLWTGLPIGMSYSSRNDTLTITKDGGTTPFMEMPKWSVPILSSDSVKGIFIHELGHDYTYQVLDELDEQKLRHESYKDLGKDLVEPEIQLIVEGVGQYFAIRAGQVKPWAELSWPKRDHIDDIYSGTGPREYGYQFIAPILDKSGVRQGISLIFSNAKPSLEEIINPPLFHQRVLGSLR